MAPDAMDLSISTASAIEIPTAEEGVRMRDLVLQTLDVFLPSKLTGTGRLFHSKEMFSGSVDAWKGKYFVFSPSAEHIDWERYLQNPAKELQKYDARIVGVNDVTRIPETGTPRLESWGWFWDDEVNKLADDGKLGLSTDFNAPFEGEQMIGYPKPNYILVFPMDVVNSQNDIGARVLNSAASQETTTMDEETKGAIAELKGLITGFISAFKNANVQNSNPEPVTQIEPAAIAEVAPSVPVEYLDKIEAMKAENEKTSAELAEIKAQYDAMKAAEAERAEADKAAQAQKLETIWQTTIMPKLPAALLVDEAKAAEIKKMAIEQPLEFMQQYGDYINKTEINVANSNPSGQSHQNSNPDTDKPVVIGSYNARTGGFE